MRSTTNVYQRLRLYREVVNVLFVCGDFYVTVNTRRDCNGFRAWTIPIHARSHYNHNLSKVTFAQKRISRFQIQI